MIYITSFHKQTQPATQLGNAFSFRRNAFVTFERLRLEREIRRQQTLEERRTAIGFWHCELLSAAGAASNGPVEYDWRKQAKAEALVRTIGGHGHLDAPRASLALDQALESGKEGGIDRRTSKAIERARVRIREKVTGDFNSASAKRLPILPTNYERIEHLTQVLRENELVRGFLAACLGDLTLLAPPFGARDESYNVYQGYLLFNTVRERIISKLDLNPVAKELLHRIVSESNHREYSLATRQRLREIFTDLYEHAQQDIAAAEAGDPAVKSWLEIIATYPGVHLITNHRFAHRLYEFNLPDVARIFSEIAHTLTGGDIHPGAEIGRYFFIDHVSGVVIGETAVIGDWVRIYQGVTLGALSFPKHPDGSFDTDKKRHPTIEGGTRENLTILASNVDVLGPVTIGAGAKLFPGVKVTTDIPPGARVIDDFEGRVLIDGDDGNGKVTHKDLRAQTNS